MAQAVAPIQFDATGTWRWSVRTDSIHATTEALSSLWGRMAAEAGDSVVGDNDGISVRTRTSVLTLVVVAPRPELIERAMATVSTLASRHPSRAVVLSPTDPDGPASFEAHIYASCHLPERGATEICTEEILIKVGGELAQHLSSTVAPLLIHDLPVVLWWPADVPFGRPDFADLADECDRLFVDSGQFRNHGLDRLLGMSDAVYGGLVVHDVSWMRLMLWRELLAACFDHPLLIHELKHLRSIRVDIARPGGEVRLARAVLFVGWLMARLRLQVVKTLHLADDDTWTATVRSGKRSIGIEIRPVEVEYSGAVRGAGSVVRAELQAHRAEAHTQVNVTRQADHLLATADWNGASVIRRAMPLERFEEAPYLAGSLDHTGHERLFAQALEKAVELIGDAGR
ncbi:MAG: glucose-6-phosphate dehydrogenase assembly protein OpcA [Chloroflexota bacterium]|nr:glucose-6-phosphate dehydrogenase assembly protein OpcA [Chloroflexota bacterium]